MLELPHSDGSPLYVPEGEIRLGDRVPVRVRVPKASGSTEVHARTVVDGEPEWTHGVADGEDEVDTWWRLEIPVANPTARYRFLLNGGAFGYRWLNGEGVHERDVPDTHDFQLSTAPAPPAWTRRSVVYQVFPDRFARGARRSAGSAGAATSAGADGVREWPSWAIPQEWDDPVIGRGPETPRQLFGGDLRGIVERLDHIASLGVTTVYVTPVFPSQSNHRYDATSFDAIDPLLGGDGAFADLAQALHARGMRLIADLTANHSGVGHEWFQRAQADRRARERDWYYFDGDGPEDYAGWLGVKSLPKFDLGSADLRRELLEGPDSVVARWMREPYRLDGWRIDVANMAGRYRDDDYTHEVARLMRETMASVNPDSYLVAEHGHDPTRDLDTRGWHGTMAYAWFTRPVWSWLRDPSLELPFLGLPTPVPLLPGQAIAATMRDFSAGVPWSAFTASYNRLGSHDTARISSVVGGDVARQEVAVGMAYTLPGMPMVFAGDEVGLEGLWGEDSRRTMPWDRADQWPQRLLRVYRELGSLRQTPALVDGGLRWVHLGTDSLVWLRESPTERLLVQATRAPHTPVSLSGAALAALRLAPGERVLPRYGDQQLRVGDDGVLRLPGDGPAFGVWQLP
ncbi:MAG: glycoside hydrolase family 13 protein [Actinomycetes bacterium]